MGRQTNIEWTDATWSPVWGCSKVSEECKNCYAEAVTTRFGKAEWGPQAPRPETKQPPAPIAWDRKAAKERGPLVKVFPSMVDIFEDHADWNLVRPGFLDMVAGLKATIFQILTKRIELVNRMLANCDRELFFQHPLHWIGTTIGMQKYVRPRGEALIQVPALVRFLSVEPILEEIDLSPILKQGNIHWVIVGGESMPQKTKARKTQLAWFWKILDQCEKYKVAFFMKQLGNNCDYAHKDSKGADPKEWPDELQVRHYPLVPGLNCNVFSGVYRHIAIERYRTGFPETQATVLE